MKTLILFTLLPIMLCGTCYDCDFAYQKCFRKYREHYEHTAIFHKKKIYRTEDLKSDKDKALFYSGAAFSLNELMIREEKY